MLVAKGYPDIGWNPCGGERYLDFLRFAVFVNGEEGVAVAEGEVWSHWSHLPWDDCSHPEPQVGTRQGSLQAGLGLAGACVTPGGVGSWGWQGPALPLWTYWVLGLAALGPGAGGSLVLPLEILGRGAGRDLVLPLELLGPGAGWDLCYPWKC